MRRYAERILGINARYGLAHGVGIWVALHIRTHFAEQEVGQRIAGNAAGKCSNAVHLLVIHNIHLEAALIHAEGNLVAAVNHREIV